MTPANTAQTRSTTVHPTAERSTSVIGIDMGGTTTKLGLLTRQGTRLEMFRSMPTGARRPRTEVLADLTNAVRALSADATAVGQAPGGIGLGLPAAMSRSGHIEVLPNFAPGWTGVSVVAELAVASGLPVVAINDARAFTLAEATFGAAAGAQSVLGVTLGTGVGGGLVLDGRLYLGASGKAGELGHQIVDRNGPLCGCGSHGCLETYASATALIASVTRGFLQGSAARLCELADHQLAAVTPELIAEAASQGDATCRDAIDRVAVALGVALANVVTLLAVERIIVGGGLAGLGDLLFAPLLHTLHEYARLAGADMPDVLPASLGSEAGALGAALVANN